MIANVVLVGTVFEVAGPVVLVLVAGTVVVVFAARTVVVVAGVAGVVVAGVVVAGVVMAGVVLDAAGLEVGDRVVVTAKRVVVTVRLDVGVARGGSDGPTGNDPAFAGTAVLLDTAVLLGTVRGVSVGAGVVEEGLNVDGVEGAVLDGGEGAVLDGDVEVVTVRAKMAVRPSFRRRRCSRSERGRRSAGATGTAPPGLSGSNTTVLGGVVAIESCGPTSKTTALMLKPTSAFRAPVRYDTRFRPWRTQRVSRK